MERGKRKEGENGNERYVRELGTWKRRKRSNNELGKRRKNG